MPPGRPQPLVEEAQQALNERRFGDAIALANQLLAANEQDVDGWRILGTASLVNAGFHDYENPNEISKRQMEKGLEALDQALSIEPRNPITLNAKGFCLLILSRWSDAWGVLQLAIEIDPSYPQPYSGGACSLVAMESWDKAEQLINQYYGQFPDGASLDFSVYSARVNKRAEYNFRPGLVLTVNIESGTFMVSEEVIRVFGSGGSFEEAMREWNNVFHLNYTDFDDTSDALSPSGEEYAEQLRKAVTG